MGLTRRILDLFAAHFSAHRKDLPLRRVRTRCRRIAGGDRARFVASPVFDQRLLRAVLRILRFSPLPAHKCPAATLRNARPAGGAVEWYACIPVGPTADHSCAVVAGPNNGGRRIAEYHQTKSRAKFVRIPKYIAYNNIIRETLNQDKIEVKCAEFEKYRSANI